MSSFPQHTDNINELKDMGFDVSAAFEREKVSIESWGYDEQTYLLEEIIGVLNSHGFKVKET